MFTGVEWYLRLQGVFFCKWRKILLGNWCQFFQSTGLWSRWRLFLTKLTRSREWKEVYTTRIKTFSWRVEGGMINSYDSLPNFVTCKRNFPTPPSATHNPHVCKAWRISRKVRAHRESGHKYWKQSMWKGRERADWRATTAQQKKKKDKLVAKWWLPQRWMILHAQQLSPITILLFRTCLLSCSSFHELVCIEVEHVECLGM